MPICDENLHSVFYSRLLVFNVLSSCPYYTWNLFLSMFSLFLHVLFINNSVPCYYKLPYQYVEAEYSSGSETSIWVPFESQKVLNIWKWGFFWVGVNSVVWLLCVVHGFEGLSLLDDLCQRVLEPFKSTHPLSLICSQSNQFFCGNN